MKAKNSFVREHLHEGLQYRHDHVARNQKKDGDASRVSKASGYLLRTLLLDLPLIFLFALVVSTFVFQHVMHEYLVPQIELLKWVKPRDYTYYNRACDEKDITTNSTADLIVTDAKDAVEITLTHGASVYPDLLSDQMAQELRDYIMEQNKKRNSFDFVIQPEKRHSWGMTPNEHPTVARALNEILSNKRFRESIEAIAGKDPAIVECTQITNTYGAVNQHYHMDVGRIVSASAYARNAVPSYSLFIPLQNTTKDMGATGICPGTLLCGFGSDLSCREHGFQVFEESGVWPKGWGFLYSTALAHRGSAHNDPSGQDRVVFMLTFVSRPRVGKNTLETRYISDHFFNHWLSWGHTVSDFADPRKYMPRPWQTLRTLGIYKWSGRKWGWDYATLLLLFIGNVGYEGSDEGDLHLFVYNTWLSRLPSFLQVDNQNLRGSMAKKWVQYCNGLSAKWRRVFVAAYAVSFCFSSLILVLVNGKSAMKYAFARLALFHGIVLLATFFYLQKVSTGTWAKNIKSGRLYRTPLNSRGPELPSTLPLLNDVLTPDDFQSDYLDSFSRILDYGHPGNRQWNSMLKNYSVGYNKMELRLQEQLSSNLVLWARQQQRRILTKNHLNQWAELDEDRARRFAHKELMKASNPFVEHAVRWTEFLLSETKYGYWRDTAMHLSLIPSLLRDLQGKLLQVSSNNKSTVSPSNVEVAVVSGRELSVHSSLSVLPNRAALSVFPVSERSNISAELPIVEPYPGAWLRVGDIAEARFKKSSGEWFRGVIRTADLQKMQWDVDYFDGKADRGLCHRCVRPFVPFVVGERVQYNGGDSKSSASEATIVRVVETEKLYDVALLNSSGAVRKLPINMLHRFRNDSYVGRKGNHALAYDGSSFVSVIILDVNGNGTFTVGDEDGRTGVVGLNGLRPDMAWYQDYYIDDEKQ